MTQELMQRLGIQSPETAEKVEQFLLALEERNRLLTEKSAALEREKTLAEEALQNAKKSRPWKKPFWKLVVRTPKPFWHLLTLMK